MRNFKELVLLSYFIHISFCMELQSRYDHTETNEAADSDAVRDRRGVIEEEKFYNIHDRQTLNRQTPWIPGPLPPEDDPTTKISITNDVKEVLPLYQTTERVTDKPTGRGARASNENWIKLPYPGHDDNQGDILTPPQASGDLINSRMPRVNFVTQSKGLEAQESRNDKESITRATRTEESLRSEFVRPDEERSKYKPVYPRQAVFYPDDARRPIYDERYVNYPIDDMYRRDPYFEMYDRRRIYPVAPYGPRVDRFDEPYDNLVPRKPKRIIYYTHLPEVVRTPPSVDLRYRYTVDPYRRYEDDLYARNGRYDYRFRPRPPYPYAPLRKEERNYRDLAIAGTVTKDKKIDEKVTPTPILPQKEDKTRVNMNRNNNRNLINSHQYHDSGDSYNEAAHKGFQDPLRHEDSYSLRFEEPLFQGAVDDMYHRKY